MQIELEKYLASNDADLSNEGLEAIDVSIKKTSEVEILARPKIPLSSLCTSACFSSVSSVLASTRSSMTETFNTLSAEDQIDIHNKIIETFNK